MPVINEVPDVPPAPVPGPAPCGWTIDTSCCPDWAGFDIAVRERAEAWATQILWALTGRRFGACELTVRPCGPRCRDVGGWRAYPVVADGYGTGGLLAPYIREGTWFNCGCVGACACRPACEAWLPGPVATVVEVTVDGVVIDPSAYRVDDRQWLVRTDGECWPDCQDLDTSDPTADGTFFVTYTRGTPVPVAGQIAAGILACEFAKACAGADCRLPRNLVALSRQGVDIALPDPTDLIGQGLTGIADVDLWIRSVNPTRLTHRLRVWSPDMDYPRVRTS